MKKLDPNWPNHLIPVALGHLRWTEGMVWRAAELLRASRYFGLDEEEQMTYEKARLDWLQEFIKPKDLEDEK